MESEFFGTLKARRVQRLVLGRFGGWHICFEFCKVLESTWAGLWVRVRGLYGGSEKMRFMGVGWFFGCGFSLNGVGE